MKQLRMHQRELSQRAVEITKGAINSKYTVAHISPGGGKSISAALFSKNLLETGYINSVIWVCPRASLSQQAADGFQDLDLNPFYSIRRAENTYPLFRGTFSGCIGYSTTYQAVAANPELHNRDSFNKKYLLILDEPHHLKIDDKMAWKDAIEGLVTRAQHVLFMTGTIERHDNKLIPFIPYEQDDGLWYPKKDIIYSRYDALMEQAVVPIEFTYEKGWVQFEDDLGVRKIDISTAEDDEVSKVIQTFLSKTSYRDKLIDRGITEWLEARKTYPSRAIIICSTQKMARDVAEKVQQKYKVKTALAISDDTKSQKIIKAFRKNQYGDVLVTVGMAYEGLDVPDCKYLIGLTNIRSLPWLEQAFARVTRVDYKALSKGITYDKQKAHIYVPDDPRMVRVVDLMLEEQDRGLRYKKKGKGPKREIGFNRGAFKPMEADSSGIDKETLEADKSQVFENNIKTSQEEQDKLKLISMLIRRRDSMRRLSRGTTMRMVVGKFKKPGERLALAELTEIISFLEELIRTRQ